MSKHEFRDEDGNVIDPSEIESGGYEVVDGAPAVEQAPAPKRKRGKVVAASAAVIALLAGGGGAAYVLTSGHGGGPAPVAAPSSSASVVAPSSSTLASSSPSSSAPAANGVNATPLPLHACLLGEADGVNSAQWPAGTPRPSLAMKVVDSVELPPTFTGLASSQKSDAEHRVQILQTAPDALGIYWDQRDSGLGPAWWKVSVETRTGRPVVAGEGAGTGNDRDFPGACTRTFESGTYLVVGRGIPGGAQAQQPGQIALSALKVDASSLQPDAPQIVWAVAGNRLLKTELVRTGTGAVSDPESSVSASTSPEPGDGAP
ncbi:hypothetical protein [Gordonia sp. 852002-51296_SCH5728562-b]|uniref:hypothetical protein n=1 Tax=Gordonia sp. 852002-51296_SCH5728562-b TaxID=1834101 RepID=UPI0007EBBE5C|nr:hypothetical protein [Gordonia sp. 852002-51296_SCH5728562-b]OBA43982.1 hypothetical protein A5766_00070 [Gordonia sp. 852002-51296_SCH5728562-b]